MDQVLLFDTETTGLDPAKDHCIEVAAVRYSLVHAAVVAAHSVVLDTEGGNPAEPINRIPPGVLPLGETPPHAWAHIQNLSGRCEAVLAHNADFDRQWVPQYAAILTLPWIDTCDGMTWPKQTKPSSNLISLALDHGIGVSMAHRALADCLLLAQLLTRCHELGCDLNALLAPALRPRGLFQALVSYDDRELAKAAGFHWEAETKRWLRKLALEDADKLGFRVRRID